MIASWWNRWLRRKALPAPRGARPPRLQHLRERRPGVRQADNAEGAMPPGALASAPGSYALATGQAAAYRLGLLHGLYGPGTRRVLLEAGLRPGMRVADFGCGVGMVTGLLADIVGPQGRVVGIDASAAQLAQARALLGPTGTNTSFV